MDLEQLERLAKLKESGALTQEEFEAKKKEILGVKGAVVTTATNQKLWNPRAVANWSLIFSPIFGAFLQAQNWEVLGEHKKYESSMLWVYAGCLLGFLILILPDVQKYGGLLWLPFLIAWYFISGKKQIKFIEENLENKYEKQGWLKPLSIAAILYVAFTFFLLIGDLPESIAETASAKDAQKEQAYQPDEAFLKSIVIVRAGILDLGETTVAQYVDRLKTISLDDGSNPKIVGWEKNNNRYILIASFVDNKKIRFTFVHDLSNRSEGKISLLQTVDMAGQEVDPMAFTMMVFSR